LVVAVVAGPGGVDLFDGQTVIVVEVVGGAVAEQQRDWCG
jgi:hypothetical protein